MGQNSEALPNITLALGKKAHAAEVLETLQPSSISIHNPPIQSTKVATDIGLPAVKWNAFH